MKNLRPVISFGYKLTSFNSEDTSGYIWSASALLPIEGPAKHIWNYRLQKLFAVISHVDGRFSCNMKGQ